MPGMRGEASKRDHRENAMKVQAPFVVSQSATLWFVMPLIFNRAEKTFYSLLTSQPVPDKAKEKQSSKEFISETIT